MVGRQPGVLFLARLTGWMPESCFPVVHPEVACAESYTAVAAHSYSACFGCVVVWAWTWLGARAWDRQYRLGWDACIRD